jgi:hypothetical protein
MLTQNAFTEPRLADDLDLLAEVTTLLSKANHPAPSKWTTDNIVKDAHGAAPKLQRFLINRYWNVQLGLCKESMTAVRFCLFETGEHKDYLDTFNKGVVPSIVKHNLGA